MRIKQIMMASGLLVGLAACSSPEVDMVKGGSLSSCSNHTLEEMVDGFLGSPSWESGESDDGVKYVNVSGDMILSGKEVTGMLQFTIGKDSETFQYRAFEINEVPQNNFMAGALLKKMCDSAVSSSGVISDYKKKSITEGMKSGVKNIALAEEVYFSDNTKYVTDLSELVKVVPSITDFLKKANVDIEMKGSDGFVYIITAQSKENPSISVTFDSEKSDFIGN